MNDNQPMVPYKRQALTDEAMLHESSEWLAHINDRRTVREFSDEPVPIEVIENCIMAASTAPSGAHKQPWTFCIIRDLEIKKQIRIAAEKEEYENYHRRMSEEWLDDLRPLGTNEHKPFLETAPYLIVLMKKAYDLSDSGDRETNYYVNESVGIAAGFLLTALFKAGLMALTHTPSPMMFLKRILNRPKNEQPFLLIPVGKPLNTTMVPDLARKPKDQVIAHY